MPKSSYLPSYLRLEQALAPFAQAGLKTQSAKHIKPLHCYIAMRLVIEGGFDPTDITPRPPIVMTGSGRQRRIAFCESAATESEATVIGGLKSKRVDVVVSKPGVGPVLAISVKGTKKSFRNLTNRMEEAIGDSTNVHIMYPGLVYGFFHILLANHAGTPNLEPPDTSVDAQGNVVKSVSRYHDILRGLAGRRLVRDDYTRYEAVGFALVESGARAGAMFGAYPTAESPLAPEKFFQSLLDVYDLRYPYMANIKGLRRHWWLDDSPMFTELDKATLTSTFGYAPRVGVPEPDDEEDDSQEASDEADAEGSK